MKILVKDCLEKTNDTQLIVLPYQEEDQIWSFMKHTDFLSGLRTEWIRTLLRKEDKVLFAANEEVMYHIRLLHVADAKREKSALVWKQEFQKLGNELEESCSILMDLLAESTQNELAPIAVQGLLEGSYTFRTNEWEAIRTQGIYPLRDRLTEEKEELSVTLVSTKLKAETIWNGEMVGHCINYARTLGNLPNNYLGIKEFIAYAKELAAEYHMKIEVLRKSELEELHSGGILAVNQGNTEEDAAMIVIHYQGTSDQIPFKAIVGKGVMFDAGGYHLKNRDGMEGMKSDMCGAANVLAVMEILAKTKAAVNVMAVLPVVENLIGPNACKMGDVIRTLSGKTVEIYNTDAEGRLILCDALAYAVQNGAQEIIDLATLTYSCQAALGKEISGIFCNQEETYQHFSHCACKAGEKIWRLPLDEVYHEQVHHTEQADLINYAPSYGAGASIAACFLEEFIPNGLPWIHLDVVGTATRKERCPYGASGATGVLTSAIVQYLTDEKI